VGDDWETRPRVEIRTNEAEQVAIAAQHATGVLASLMISHVRNEGVRTPEMLSVERAPGDTMLVADGKADAIRDEVEGQYDRAVVRDDANLRPAMLERARCRASSSSSPS
jgi:hypothetical protein